jgi:hypothetical protein
VGAHGTIRSTRGFREVLEVGARGTTEGISWCREVPKLGTNGAELAPSSEI